MLDTSRPRRGPSPRRLFAIAVAAAAACFILTLSYGYADHAPAPHGVRIAVAAPPGVVREVSAGLGRAAPGGFTVLAAPSAAAVRGSVLSQSAAGGLVTGAAGPVTIVTAAAAGPATVSAARDVTYLPASDLAHPLLVLAIWLAASLAVLAAVDLLHLAERRRSSSSPA